MHGNHQTIALHDRWKSSCVAMRKCLETNSAATAFVVQVDERQTKTKIDLRKSV
jgi:hypothetical protein